MQSVFVCQCLKIKTPMPTSLTCLRLSKPFEKSGKLIVVESTIPPGTTRSIVLPILEKSGLKVGRDFFLAYSPKRVHSSLGYYSVRNTPKVVGGMTACCTTLAALFYHQFDERMS